MCAVGYGQETSPPVTPKKNSLGVKDRFALPAPGAGGGSGEGEEQGRGRLHAGQQLVLVHAVQQVADDDDARGGAEHDVVGPHEGHHRHCGRRRVPAGKGPQGDRRSGLGKRFVRPSPQCDGDGGTSPRPKRWAGGGP